MIKPENDKLVSDLCPIAILTEEIAVEVTEVVGVSPALWYFRYIASIFLTTQASVVYASILIQFN